MRHSVEREILRTAQVALDDVHRKLWESEAFQRLRAVAQEAHSGAQQPALQERRASVSDFGEVKDLINRELVALGSLHKPVFEKLLELPKYRALADLRFSLFNAEVCERIGPSAAPDVTWRDGLRGSVLLDKPPAGPIVRAVFKVEETEPKVDEATGGALSRLKVVGAAALLLLLQGEPKRGLQQESSSPVPPNKPTVSHASDGNAPDRLQPPSIRSPEGHQKPGEFDTSAVIATVTRSGWSQPDSAFWKLGEYDVAQDGAAQLLNLRLPPVNTNGDTQTRITFTPGYDGPHPHLQGTGLSSTPLPDNTNTFKVLPLQGKEPFSPEMWPKRPPLGETAALMVDRIEAASSSDQMSVLTRHLEDFTYIVSNDLQRLLDLMSGAWYDKAAAIRVGDCDVLSEYAALLLKSAGRPATCELGYLEDDGKIVASLMHMRLRTEERSWEVTTLCKRHLVNLEFQPDDLKILEGIARDTSFKTQEERYAAFRQTLEEVLKDPYYRRFDAKGRAALAMHPRGLPSWNDVKFSLSDIIYGIKSMPRTLATLLSAIPDGLQAISSLRGRDIGVLLTAFVATVGSLTYGINRSAQKLESIKKQRNDSFRKDLSGVLKRCYQETPPKEEGEPAQSYGKLRGLRALAIDLNWRVATKEVTEASGAGDLRAAILTKLAFNRIIGGYRSLLGQVVAQRRILSRLASAGGDPEKHFEVVSGMSEFKPREKVDPRKVRDLVEKVVASYKEFEKKLSPLLKALPKQEGDGERGRVQTPYSPRLVPVEWGTPVDARAISWAHLAKGALVVRQLDTEPGRIEVPRRSIVIALPRSIESPYPFVELYDKLLEGGPRTYSSIRAIDPAGNLVVLSTNGGMSLSREDWAKLTLQKVVEVALRSPVMAPTWWQRRRVNSLEFATSLGYGSCYRLSEMLFKEPALVRKADFINFHPEFLANCGAYEPEKKHHRRRMASQRR